MPVFKVKDYKIVNNIKVKKNKEEYNKETCNGTKVWYFKCYYINALGERKQKKSKKFASKEQTVKEEAKFLLSVGECAIDNNITFNRIFDELIQKKESEVRETTLNKIKNYYKHIEPELGKIQINKLTLQQFQFWKNEMNKKNLCCTYKNKIYKLLCELVNYSELYYNTTTNVLKLGGKFVDNNEKKKEMLFFTEEEFEKFVSVIKEHLWISVFETLFYCGFRQGELQALNWNDIDFNKNIIDINKTLTTKIKGKPYSIYPPKTLSSYRKIPMTKNIRENLTKLKEMYSQLEGFNNDWFVFGGIKPLPETTIQKHKNKYCTLAEVKQIRIHDFRHSCASLLISRNADPVLVSKYLGHADVSMTLNKYSHMYKSKLDEIILLIEKKI